MTQINRIIAVVAFLTAIPLLGFPAGLEWGGLSAMAQRRALHDLLRAADTCDFCILRNRADEGFRMSDIEQLPESQQVIYVGLMERGFARLENLGGSCTAFTSDRVYCFTGRGGRKSLRSSDGTILTHYSPKILVTDDPLLIVGRPIDVRSAVDVAIKNCPRPNDEMLQRVALAPDIGRSSDILQVVDHLVFRLGIEDFAGTDSFSKNGVLPDDMMPIIRRRVETARSVSGMLTLSRRDVSELMLVLLGKEKYAERRKAATWLIPAEEMAELSTELGKSLQFYKTHEDERKKLFEEVGLMKDHREAR